MWCREELVVEKIDVELATAEVVGLRVSVGEECYSVITIYRPPRGSGMDFITEIGEKLGTLGRKKVCILGDINIDLLKASAMAESYLDMLAANGFRNCILEATRVEIRDGKLTKSLIDHIVTNVENKRIESLLVKSRIADHYPVCILFVGTKENVARSKSTYRKLDDIEIINELNEVDWKKVLNEKAVEDNYNRFLEIYRKTVDRHIRTITVRSLSKSWLTEELLQMMKERDRQWKKITKKMKAELLSRDW